MAAASAAAFFMGEPNLVEIYNKCADAVLLPLRPDLVSALAWIRRCRSLPQRSDGRRYFRPVRRLQPASLLPRRLGAKGGAEAEAAA